MYPILLILHSGFEDPEIGFEKKNLWGLKISFEGFLIPESCYSVGVVGASAPTDL